MSHDVSHDVIIVGAGISGLAAAFELRRRRPEWSLLVLEKEESAGGKVRSSSADGYTFDWGPSGFQGAPRTLELVSQLGLEGKLVAVSDRARYRYLYRDGGLRRVPLKPQEFLSSELLSPAGKLRALLEPLIPSRAAGEEESVFGFVARHFGSEVARALAAPLVLGVTAGDARKLSVEALFPRLVTLEREHGSLLRAMAALRRKPKAIDSTDGTALYSFAPGGMGTLTSELGRRMGTRLRTGANVEALARNDAERFELTLEGGERLLTERVVLATPAFATSRLLAPLLPAASETLGQIRYADADVFALAHDRVDVPHPLDGFGFLVPRDQGVRSLGVIWSSSLFEESRPPGTVLLRVIAGGTFDPGFGQLSESAALAAVRRDLKLTLGITAQPLFSRRIGIPRAIPQYELGHRRRVESVMQLARGLPGLVLAGNAYYGVAVNDCVRDAVRVVNELTG